ncbi:hypothetical protein ACFLQN_00700 [Candidatus Aenigmatarchaeota archaeon]
MNTGRPRPRNDLRMDQIPETPYSFEADGTYGRIRVTIHSARQDQPNTAPFYFTAGTQPNSGTLSGSDTIGDVKETFVSK